MPHLTVEHSADCGADIDWQAVLGELHRVTAATIATDIRNCKSRVVRHECFRVGDDSCGDGFVHLDALVLEGRSTQARGELGGRLLAVLREAFAADLERLQITVFVHDIERAVYAKHPPGTLTAPARMR